MTTKKTHPADTADLALIPACKKFTATILKGGKPHSRIGPQLTVWAGTAQTSQLSDFTNASALRRKFFNGFSNLQALISERRQRCEMVRETFAGSPPAP